ncbi:MAG: hypothetical protein HFI57_01990 [Lachnospiraceae bacterium]|nr:hypothetical protein [Lachnospiraceae bacterium]
MKALIKKGSRNIIKKRGVLLAALAGAVVLTACQASGSEEEKSSADTETVSTTAGNESSGDLQISQGEMGNPDEDTETGAEEKAEETDGTAAEPIADNFSADPAVVADYAALIKEAVAQKDMEKLADLTGFPVYVGLEGVDVVESREDFLALDPAAVFSEEMCASIEKADTSDLAPSKAGFTLMGGGEDPSITFGVVNGELRIKGINY